MAMGWKPTRALIFTPLALLLFILGAVAQPHAALAAQGSTNGFAGQMPAIFNGQPVTININQLTTAESALLAHNGSVNKIYAIQDLDIPNPQFVPVINEIQGQGFNPLWDQFTYHFNSLRLIQGSGMLCRGYFPGGVSR